MKKENFITLLVGVVGGLLFSLGICMCLLPEWSALVPGVAMTAVGALTLLALLFARRKSLWRPKKPVDKRALAAVLLGVIGVLILGLGMSITMVWQMLAPGILVSILGIAVLLCIIPVKVGLK